MKGRKMNKKGIALESAILFMVVLFSLSMLLMTIVTSAAYRIKANDAGSESRLTADQLGETYLSYLDDGGVDADGLKDAVDAVNAVKNEGYSFELAEKSFELRKKGKTVLTIKVNENSEVIQWIYQ